MLNLSPPLDDDFYLVSYVGTRSGKTGVIRWRYSQNGAHAMAERFRKFPHARLNCVLRVRLK